MGAHVPIKADEATTADEALTMTKAQARRRVIANARAFLELEIASGGTWINHSGAPACDPLSERDCAMMRTAARDVVQELCNLEAKCRV